MSTKLESERQPSLYDKDFFEWAQAMAERLRAGKDISPADSKLVAEELDAMAKRDARALNSRAINVSGALAHRSCVT